MYFARYAVQGTATPVQSYGLGWIFVHMGDLFGVFALVFVDAGMAAGAFSLDQVAAVSMALLVVSTMFVLNDGRSFSFGTEAAAALAGASGAAVADAAMADAQVRGADGASDGCSGAARPHPALDEDASAPGAARSGASDADDLTARIRELAARETEVFDLLARGRSVPYVRDALVISRETAATHAKHVYAKLGVHSRQELIDLVH